MFVLSRKLLRRYPIILYRQFCTNQYSKWIEPIGEKTDIQIYNCIAQKKVPLILERDFLTWYTCGPTVYDSAHIGHGCTYIRVNVLQRILKHYFNINVVSAINITDIDDKIIQKSFLQSIDCHLLSNKFELEFWDDMHKLAVDKPNLIYRVTECMPQIIRFIQKLIDTEQAYTTKLGNVYFSLSNYTNYSKLQNINREINLIDKIDTDKRAPEDFALWKRSSDVEPGWNAPWGRGRPGWHIECSVMATMAFGEKIDIHAGGIDLRFPHHENEEAQSCSFHNTRQWVNYWIHTGTLNLQNATKMSKSLNNTIAINELLINYTSNEFRIACLLTHYRQPIEFSDDRMKTARAILTKFYQFFEFSSELQRKHFRISNDNHNALIINLKYTNNIIRQALCDDFDIPKVFKTLLNTVAYTYKLTNEQQSDDGNNVQRNIDVIVATQNLIMKMLNIFGVDTEKSFEKGIDASRFENILNVVTSFRYGVRKIALENQNDELFVLCDRMRNDFSKTGIEIKDRKDDSFWIDKSKLN